MTRTQYYIAFWGSLVIANIKAQDLDNTREVVSVFIWLGLSIYALIRFATTKE